MYFFAFVFFMRAAQHALLQHAYIYIAICGYTNKNKECSWTDYNYKYCWFKEHKHIECKWCRVIKCECELFPKR